MKFDAKKPNVTLWNTEENCALIRAVEGVFETDDPKVAKKIEAAGYVCIDAPKPRPPRKEVPADASDIRND